MWYGHEIGYNDVYGGGSAASSANSEPIEGRTEEPVHA